MPIRTVQAKVTVTRSETREYTRAELCKRLNVPEDALFELVENPIEGEPFLIVTFTRTTERKPKAASNA